MKGWLVTLFLVAGVSLVGVVSCLTRPTFACTTTDQCGANGTCEADGFCSFTDSSCPSGRRYGEDSGPKANKCFGQTACQTGADCAGGRCACGLCDPEYGQCCAADTDCTTDRCGAMKCDPKQGDRCDTGSDCVSGSCFLGSCT